MGNAPAPIVVPPAVRGLGAVVLVVGLGLAAWQLQRDGERNEGREEAEAAAAMPVLTELAPPSENLWRVVRWSGRFEVPAQLIGGRLERDQRGYGLVQVFRRDDGLRIVVDRGWVPADALEARLAALDAGATLLVGQLRPPIGNAGVPPSAGHGTTIWPAKAWPSVVAHAGADPSAIVLAGTESGERASREPPLNGFERVPARDNTSLHYAKQWFAIAILGALTLSGSLLARIRQFL